MYGSASTHDLPSTATTGLENEDPILLAEFEARIARGEKIEPGDWIDRKSVV